VSVAPESVCPRGIFFKVVRNGDSCYVEIGTFGQLFVFMSGILQETKKWLWAEPRAAMGRAATQLCTKLYNPPFLYFYFLVDKVVVVVLVLG
jgi:hypothetical protein